VTDRSTYLSIIIPVYNEEESIPLLHERLSRTLKELELSYEVIYVDDGSADGSYKQLQALVERDQRVRVVRLRRNFGQTAAMSAGVDHSTGQVLIFMDGDLQNDPIDIPRLLAKLDEGYDVVSGWRKNRQDAAISRKLPSMIANKLISKITGVHLHDYGCTLKAYRWEVFRHMRLYGEMHRFLPAYATLAGAAVTELEVSHHPRQFGVSKYGISRTVRVILDLITLKFLSTYGTKPMYAFGMLGLGSILLGGIFGTASFLQSIFSRRVPSSRQMIILSWRFIGFGVQFIMMGLTAEQLMRTYYESQNKAVYVVRETLGGEQERSDEQQDTHEHLFPLYRNEA
jgi:glycosyltransferase involved in cell wall biosynthesis